MFVLSSCISDTPKETALNSATTILNALKTGETEELKNLFCEEIKDTHDLDEEILSAIEFIDGNIIEDGTWYGMSSGGTSIRDGQIVRQTIHPGMQDIKTDTGKIYRITFVSYLVTDDNKHIGMTNIVIYDETNDDIDSDNMVFIGEVI